ncbi:hypothetical protein SAY87_011292 [Trapa incisa]|uniref:Transmembrane protein 45B n=1 Tax=Trapa incisa TaxID=236973 RepID=A0AAN7GFC8_9MYRT|nr:hypothetical protein SAY87_011292 [Trapa incisa]
MGTFLGHFFPGFTLSIVGLWHLFNSAQAFFHNDRDNFSHRHSGFALLSELNKTTEKISGVLGVLASSVFGQELFLHFHSTDHVGIEGQYHCLLQLIVLVSFLSAVTVTLSPTSFPASLLLAISVVFQGLWFMNMGFVLWVPELVPRGCALQTIEHGERTVTCSSRDAYLRAHALANLQFSWILFTVLVITASLCLKLASSSKGSTGKGSAIYQRLDSSTGQDHSMDI